MKAITIHPVWAWAIVHGHKRIENRTWRTHYRGPLLIHASAPSPGARRSDNAARSALSFQGIDVPDEVPTAALVGSVELVDVVSYADTDSETVVSDPLASGPQCWILKRPMVFTPPILTRGRQGLFEVDPALVPKP